MILIIQLDGTARQFYGLPEVLSKLAERGCKVYQFNPNYYRFEEYKYGSWIQVEFYKEPKSEAATDKGSGSDQ